MDKDVYFVAVKMFLEDGKGSLFIFRDKFGDWDLPGGRLRETDFKTPLEAVAERKLREELGEHAQYRLGKPVVFMRHERDEMIAGGKKEKRRIFAVGFKAAYLGGEITLGNNHTESKWIRLAEFRPEEYFTGGWLDGVRAYMLSHNSQTSVPLV